MSFNFTFDSSAVPALAFREKVDISDSDGVWSSVRAILEKRVREVKLGGVEVGGRR